MEQRITLLNDSENRRTDFLIISTKTTTEKINNILIDVKSKHEGTWTTEDILEALPKDCVVYGVNNHNTIFY